MIKAVKGTRDILPPSSAVWNQVEAVAREVFRIYNYQEIRTPILEETALFARGVGEETDIVSKEMYTFEDRDGSSLTLRPEATASVMRAYIEHRLDQIPGVQEAVLHRPDVPARASAERAVTGSSIRSARKRSGRSRPLVDAEVIEMVIELLRRVGLDGFQLLSNSVGDANCRPQYVALLQGEAARRGAAAVRRLPAARGDQSAARARLQGSGRSAHHRRAAIHPGSSCASPAATHFDAVRAHLDDRGIAYEVRPRMVRGLDYYMRTTFEIVHGALGAQNSVLGGGRYDGLAESLGSRVPAPGIGFSIGEDRLVMSVEQEHPDAYKADPL